MGKIPRESKGLVVWEYSGLGSVKISAVSPWSARTIGCLLCCWKIRHSDISRWSLCRQGCFRSIAIQWCNHRRCKLTVHECAMYAKFHSMAGRTFYSSCRSGRSFQKAECTVEDRQQPETAAVSPFSRASSSLFFRRSSLLSSILGWKHESHDCWLPISSHCFHAFMLSCFHAFNPLHSWQFRAQNEMLFPCLENSGRCCESIPKLFQLLIPDDSSAAARLTGLHPWCRIVHTINLIKLFRRRAPSACDLQILERCVARFFPAPCFLPSDTQDATSSQALGLFHAALVC